MPAWVRNEEQFLNRIRARMKLLGYLRKPVDKALDLQHKLVIDGTKIKQTRIKSRGGRRFPKLSERYSSRKARLFPGRPILVATGEMLSAPSFGKKISSMAALTIGKLIYKGPKRGLVHQDPLKKLVYARSWFGFRTGDAKKVGRVVAAGIVNILRRLRYE